MTPSILPLETKKMSDSDIDYNTIFGAETAKLVSENIFPDAMRSDADVERASEFIRARLELLERVIQEAIMRKQANIVMNNDCISRASKDKRLELAKRDMSYRAKAVEQKLDKGINLHELQKQQAIKSMRAIGLSEDIIAATLKKKGYIV